MGPSRPILCYRDAFLLTATFCAFNVRANRNGERGEKNTGVISLHDHGIHAYRSQPQLVDKDKRSEEVIDKQKGNKTKFGPTVGAARIYGDPWETAQVTSNSNGLDSTVTPERNNYVGSRQYLKKVSDATLVAEKNRTLMGKLTDMLMNLGGGTGATVGGTGDVSLDQDLLRRMRFQDKAVMLLLLIAYTGSLAFSASLVYRQAANNSPVVYYADPRFHNFAVDTEEIEGFLEAFNQHPKEVQLQVTGLMPLPMLPEGFHDYGVEWNGARYRVAFSFALDLTPWVVRREIDVQGSLPCEAAEGIPEDDLQRLADFLSHNKNDLAILEIQKDVEWQEWEELATNIKNHIRSNGFPGVTLVTKSGIETVSVHKNRPWANFMHSRTTKVLCALSIFGWIIYQPYMMLRNRGTQIRSLFKVDVDITSYWSLISDKIGADGFNSNSMQPLSHDRGMFTQVGS